MGAAYEEKEDDGVGEDDEAHEGDGEEAADLDKAEEPPLDMDLRLSQGSGEGGCRKAVHFRDGIH